jgi:flagellar hook-associated protein 1 FlgK
MLAARDTNIPVVQQQLDTLACDLGTAVNTAQTNGVDINGNAGTAMFTMPSTASGAAANISVAITDPNLVAAAATGEGSSGSSNATTLLNLGTGGTVSGTTPSNYYSSLVSSVGSTVSTMTSNNTAQQANVTQLTTQVTTLSGVSLDEEASNLTTYERSYQAASQVFTIINTLMASVLNLGEQSTVS